MLTIRAATTLLAQASSLPALSPIARALGFNSTRQPLTRDAAKTLDLHHLVENAELARAHGSLRLLTAQLPAHTPHEPRELTRRICHALTKNAPTQLWTIITLSADANTLCIATATTHTTTLGIAALRVDRLHIVDSDADTLRALAAATNNSDRLCHTRWTDILKRDALSARFYRTLERLVHLLARTATGKASAAERDEMALLCASRLLFLAFLEAKGWLAGNRNFLLHHCATQLQNGGRLHEKLLRPLFFGTLNTPTRQRAPAARAFGAVPFLNGGLFAPTPLEQSRRTLQFSDDAITAVVGELLDRYRFTAREDSSTWSEAAVDPEMLGRAFECLMANDERRSSGSFYTPPSLVAQAVHDALHTHLPTLPSDALNNDTEPLDIAPDTRTQLHQLRVLDPACGSGAFLVHTLERLAHLHARAGDTRALHQLRREILTRSIFGVDKNPMAVWLCELRLWLSVVIECPETQPSKIPPLPNLDHHVRVGDTLAAGDLQFASEQFPDEQSHQHFAATNTNALITLRSRYARATGLRKRTLARALDKEERLRALAECERRLNHTQRERRDLLQTIRARDLFGERPTPSRPNRAKLLALRTRLREQQTQHRRIQLGGALPFRFSTHFADAAAAKGFHIIVGNPPWVRPHHLPQADRIRLRIEYHSIRDAAWRAGALRAGAGVGFAAQADLAVAFVERAITLLQPHGVLSLLLPAKLWRSLAGGGIRRLLAEHTHINTVRDWSEAPALFEAAVYPSLLVATRKPNSNTESHTPAPATHVAITKHDNHHTFNIPPHALSLDNDPAAPWLLLPHSARKAFQHLQRTGPALGDSPLGRPMLGVKCGCNAAFLMLAHELGDDTACVELDGRPHLIERTLLRPALRGDAIASHARTIAGVPHQSSTDSRNGLRILWTHGADGSPLRTLPPRAHRWLSRFRPRLETRCDARTRQPWWTLFRTEAARPEAARLVWADLGKHLRTTVLAPGDPTVPLNTCYVLRTPSLEDAYALEMLLTSPIAAAWLDTIAEPARGGWRRFLGWTVAALPVPANWNAARIPLVHLAHRARMGDPPSPHEHLAVTADAYGIPLTCIEPLLNWFNR